MECSSKLQSSRSSSNVVKIHLGSDKHQKEQQHDATVVQGTNTQQYGDLFHHLIVSKWSLIRLLLLVLVLVFVEAMLCMSDVWLLRCDCCHGDRITSHRQ